MISYDGLVVIVIKFEANMCDILHILYFVFIEVKQKSDESVKS